MKEPVDHILRPRLPWRNADADMTECWLNAAKVATLSREAHSLRIRDLGQQRAAMITCMTCADTSKRWKPWEESPLQAIERETSWEQRRGWGEPRGYRLYTELLAIVELIEAHREEFDGIVAKISGQREWPQTALPKNGRQTVIQRPDGGRYERGPRPNPDSDRNPVYVHWRRMCAR